MQFQIYNTYIHIYILSPIYIHLVVHLGFLTLRVIPLSPEGIGFNETPQYQEIKLHVVADLTEIILLVYLGVHENSKILLK